MYGGHSIPIDYFPVRKLIVSHEKAPPHRKKITCWFYTNQSWPQKHRRLASLYSVHLSWLLTVASLLPTSASCQAYQWSGWQPWNKTKTRLRALKISRVGSLLRRHLNYLSAFPNKITCKSLPEKPASPSLSSVCPD